MDHLTSGFELGMAIQLLSILAIAGLCGLVAHAADRLRNFLNRDASEEDKPDA